MNEHQNLAKGLGRKMIYIFHERENLYNVLQINLRTLKFQE